MGELLDRLNKVDPHPHAPGEPITSLTDRAAAAFRSASRRVSEVIDGVQQPGAPLDKLSGWTRQAPVQALAVAFLVGVIVSRQR